MNWIRGTVLLAAVWLSLASATSTKEYKAKPWPAPAGVTDEDLWAATVRVLTDRGYGLVDKDQGAGMVKTEWITSDDTTQLMFGGHVYLAWRVIVEDGALRINIDCEAQDTSPARYKCDRGAPMPTKWVEDVPVLRAEIFAEAKRRAAKRKATPPAPAP